VGSWADANAASLPTLSQRSSRDAGAKAFVVDVFSYGRVLATSWAVLISSHLKDAERHAQRVVLQQSAIEHITFAQQQLQRFSRLERPYYTRQNSKHSGLGTGGRQVCRRGFWIHATVTGALPRHERRNLAIKAKDRAVHDRDLVFQRGIVDEVAGGKIVATVDDHIPAFEDAVDVRTI